MTMSKTNEAVGEKNHLEGVGGKKWNVRYFSNNEFWKFIGYIILVVTYRNKGHNIWVITQIYVAKKT